jgi:hypothetical protein
MFDQLHRFLQIFIQISPLAQKVLLSHLFILIASLLLGQEFLVIENITITGNKKTQNYIVQKELDINRGDTIYLADLSEKLGDNRNRILNTGLFNKVDFKIHSWDVIQQKAALEIILIENWYWYPFPVFELADRNINEWLYQHKASLKRLNLGIRFMHINLTGNSDKLKFTYHTGFTNKYEVDYSFPYIQKNRWLGAYFNMLYVTHKEIAYETLENKLHFTRSETKPLLTRFRTSVGLKYRKNNSIYHTVYLEYHHKTIADTIHKKLNPNYFLLNENAINHISLNYRLLLTRVDKNIYPTYGHRFMVDFRKEGFGIFNDLNHLLVSGAWEHHVRPVNWYSFGYKLKVRKSFRFNRQVPYAYLNGLGYYDDIITGYQLYVIDGNDFAYIKTFQKFRLAELEFDIDPYMPLEQFKYLPVKLFIGIGADIGYASENQFSSNPFNNRLIFGAGLGLDVVVYENYYLSCTFTVNHTGETGIFFKGTNTFE